MKKGFPKADILSAVVFVAIAVWTYRVAGTFRVPSWATVGAGFFPRVLAVLLIFLSAVMVLQAVLAAKTADKKKDSEARRLSAAPETPADEFDSPQATQKPWYFAYVMFGVFVLYFLFLPFLGYFLTMAAGIVVLTLLMGLSEKIALKTLLRKGVPIAVGLTLLVYVVFQHLMYIRLPRGVVVPWLSRLFS